jgi:hypothetical protein
MAHEKSSEALPRILKTLLATYTCKGLYFAKGPGSFMAIKITYLLLRTLEIARQIPLFATDGFAFNDNQPIKAVGNLYFFKEHGKISTAVLPTPPSGVFALPERLDAIAFSKDTQPLYHLPAV